MQKRINRLPLIFLLFRLVLFASSPLEIIPGYGDYWNFFHQAGLGFPFLDHWSEFPPVFPVLSRIIYLLSGGREATYSYGLAVLMCLVQALSIWLFLKILELIRPHHSPLNRGWMYLILVAGLFYSWSYFDPLAVCLMLLALYFLLTDRDGWSALAIALGGLTKWFPLLILPAIWRVRKPRRALSMTASVLAVILLVWGLLYAVSPSFTQASLVSQLNKGSWETLWALLDGNLTTGNFSAAVDRLAAGTASSRTGNPALVPSWATLLLFGSLGLYLLVKARPANPGWLIHFTGLTLVIFFIWSPGYSPQWILFLLPLLLISLPEGEGLLFSAVLILVHLLEWPVLLSRGMFSALYYLIPLRTALLALLGVRFYQASRGLLGVQDEVDNAC